MERSKTIKHVMNEDDSFAITLFNSLKSYGYLLPKTSEDVEKFDELYGDTEIDTPEFKGSQNNTNQSNLESFDFNFSMAAFTSKEDANSDFLDDLNKEENTEDKNNI